MSVYLVTNNYSFSIAKVQLFLKMMFFFGFLAFWKQKKRQFSLFFVSLHLQITRHGNY